MKPFQSDGMSYDGKHFRILDQTLLPHQEKWLICDSVEILVNIIQRLAIRGAPAIGISSSILLALLAEKGRSKKGLKKDCETLLASRPTAINLSNNIAEIARAIDTDTYPLSVVQCAEKIYTEDIKLCRKIAELGVSLISNGDKILTHCHTGAIATAGIGTALGIIREAHYKDKNIFVWVDETRPLLQGARLTSWECGKHDIPHKIICDNMAAMLMKRREVDLIIVGSDRVAANGDFANKIGTYSLAVLARHHGVPFYIAAPTTTIDLHCPDGDAIPIEERDPQEIKGVSGSFGSCCWAPQKSKVFNPAFDVTPAELVTAWIFDTGILTQDDIQKKGFLKRRYLEVKKH